VGDVVPDDLAEATKAAVARKAFFEAESAAALAQKNAIDAKTDVAKARIGTVAGSSFTGLVTPAASGPKAEAMLLVSRSTNAAAIDIVTRLKTGGGLQGAKILVISDQSELTTADALLFDLQIRNIENSMNAAKAYFDYVVARDKIVLTGSGSGTQHFAILPVAGAAIDAIAKLGSYFQSDYTFGDVDVASVGDLLPGAIISQCGDCGATFIVPSNFLATDVVALTTILDPFQQRYTQLASDQLRARARAIELHNDKAAGAAELAKQYDQADQMIGRALTGFDTLTSGLAAAPDGKEPLAIRIMRQKKIQLAIGAQAKVLFVKARVAGAYYTKKSLWTFLVGPPLYSSGVIIASYNYFDPATGAVLSSGSVGKHGGYKSVRAVAKMFPVEPQAAGRE